MTLTLYVVTQSAASHVNAKVDSLETDLCAFVSSLDFLVLCYFHIFIHANTISQTIDVLHVHLSKAINQSLFVPCHIGTRSMSDL